MYRKDSPAEIAPVGEVEFVNGIAAMSASGGYGPCRVAEAIIGHADLTIGGRVREVLKANRASAFIEDRNRNFAAPKRGFYSPILPLKHVFLMA